jgi:hypothetical protein
MSRFFYSACALAAVAVLTCSALKSSPQSAASLGSPQSSVVLIKAFQPVYPLLARQARITGDVVLLLGIRQNGSVESVSAVSGHPLLLQAAENSAKQSQFECRNCALPVMTYRLRYTFQLMVPASCTIAQCGKTFEEPEQTEELPGHVTSSASYVSLCSCVPYTHVHSAKCLYLWKCKALLKPTVISPYFDVVVN